MAGDPEPLRLTRTLSLPVHFRPGPLWMSFNCIARSRARSSGLGMAMTLPPKRRARSQNQKRTFGIGQCLKLHASVNLKQIQYKEIHKLVNLSFQIKSSNPNQSTGFQLGRPTPAAKRPAARRRRKILKNFEEKTVTFLIS